MKRSTDTKLPGAEEAATALRRLSRGKHVQLRELPWKLRRAVVLHWGGLVAARKALGIPEPRKGRFIWTRELVIAEIKKLARAGVHMSTSNMLATGRHDLLNAANDHCGSWVRARELANVRFNPKRARVVEAWNSARVVEVIRERHRESESLASSKVPRSLYSAAHRNFGSWAAAVAAAGLDYEGIRLLSPVSDEELVDWIKQRAAEEPDLAVEEYRQRGEYASTSIRRWGSPEKAGAAAGLVDWPRREKHRALSRRALLRAIRELAKRQEPTNFHAVRSMPNGHFLINSAMTHFATWDDAVRAAGVALARVNRSPWTREDVLQALRDLHREHGPLAPRDIRSANDSLYDAMRRVFGSYARAMTSAGLPVVKRWSSTRELQVPMRRRPQ